MAKLIAIISLIAIMHCAVSYATPGRRKLKFLIMSEVQKNAELRQLLPALFEQCKFGEFIQVFNYGLCFDFCKDDDLCVMMSVSRDYKTCRLCLYSENVTERAEPDPTSRTYIIVEELQQAQNKCRRAECQNGGSCVDAVNSYHCECSPGYEGDHCQTETNECSGIVCQNGGSCVDGVNGYHCECSPGYEGEHCETDTNECSGVTCQNGGSCVDGVNGYHCECSPGYEGVHCETETNECSGVVCQNGGSCVDGVNGYQCECNPGYEGVHCETETNECSGVVCQNGGLCVDGVNSYHCECSPGYEGDHCETDTDECSGVTCQNGGSCVDLINNYRCDCIRGFEGDLCEIDTDDCLAVNCENNGTCIDELNGYHCECRPGFQGDHCQTMFRRFEVTLYTDNQNNAESRGQLYLTVTGSTGQCSEHRIPSYLPAGSAFTYSPNCSVDIGEIDNVTIRLDGDDEWYLNKLTVHNFVTGNLHIFFCNCWFDGGTDAVSDLPASRTISRGPFTFVMEIETGDRYNAETTDDVYVTINGAQGQCERQKITLELSRASTNTYTASCTDYIGEFLSVEFELSGDNGWFLDSVSITDELNDQEYDIKCNCWFDVGGDSYALSTRILYGIEQRFEMDVYTGNTIWARTDSSVFVTITGVEGTCDAGAIPSDLKKNPYYMFPPNCENDVGAFESVTLTLRGTNDWLLDRLVVRDVITDAQYSYTCGCWFDPNDSDDPPSRTFHSSLTITPAITPHG